MDEKQLKRSVKLFPWVSGLSADLVFWITINTLFLSTVRGFTTAEIVSLSTIASIVSLAAQPVMMWLSAKLGNTVSTRIGKFCMLAASLMFLFGQTYGWAVAAMLLYKEGAVLAALDVVVFKNNMNYLGRDDEFLPIRTRRSLIYSIATMLASLTAGFLFNVSPYLPVVLGTVLIGGCFLLSCTMTECPLQTEKAETSGKTRFPLGGALMWILLSYGLFYCLLSEGTTNSKLLIQEELLFELPLATVSILLSVIVTLSRVSRVLSNIVFSKIYRKKGYRCVYILSILQVSAYVLLIAGAFMDHAIVPKMISLALGYMLLLFVWDPHAILLDNLILERVEAKYRASVSLVRGMVCKVFAALVNVLVSAVLLKWPTLVAFFAMLLLAIIGLLMSIKLYHILTSSSQKATRAVQ